MSFLRRLLYLFALSLLLSTGIIGLLPARHAAAAGEIGPERISAHITDRSHITVTVTYNFDGTGVTSRDYHFVDRDALDSEMHFSMSDGQGCEDGQIAFFDYQPNLSDSSKTQALTSIKARIYIKVAVGQLGSQCATTKGREISVSDAGYGEQTSIKPQYQDNPIIPLQDAQNYFNYFRYVDSDHIQRVDANGSWSFTKAQIQVKGTATNIFVRDSESSSSCVDLLIIESSGTRGWLYELDSSNGFGPSSKEYSSLSQSQKDIIQAASAPSTCKILRTPNKAIDDTFNKNIVNGFGSLMLDLKNAPNLNSPPVSGGGNSAGAGGSDGLSCNSNRDPLTWILCPVFNGVSGAADWLFSSFIQPFLVTAPISTDSNEPSFKIWSSFRVYGNIFLIIGLLVLVLAQSIGGGLIDAYTVKKMVPRILIAAILINLSIYIVNFMVDITNIVGAGVGELMLSPLKASGQLSFSPGAGQSLSIVFTSGFLGTFLGGATISGILGGIAFGGGAFLGKAAIFIVFTVLIPVVLALVGVFVTLLLRKGIILLLLLVSPVAFALYCLPNTEQYFRKWWDLLFKTLLVYPIIIAIFAVADILSVTILSANKIDAGSSLTTTAINGTFANPLAAIVAFVLQFLPLLLIPFAFKFAGGAIGAIHNAVTTGRGRASELLKGRREQSARDVQTRMLEGRGDLYNKLQKRASTPGSGVKARLGRRGAGFLRDRVGGYNIEAALSQLRLEKNKELTDQIASGDDDEIRATATDANLIRASRGGLETLKGAGYKEAKYDAATKTYSDGDYRVNADTGRLQLRNISGKYYDAAEGQAGLQRWSGDRSALQRMYSYEIQKALLQEDNDSIVASIPKLQQSWGMDDDQMNSVLIGAGFEQQQKSKQWKRYTVKDKKAQFDAKGFVDEMHGQMGTYQGIGQDADTWVTMGNTYVEGMKRAMAGDAQAQASVQKMGQIAQQFGNMGGAQLAQYVQQQLAAGGQNVTPGAATDIAAAIEEFMKTVDAGQVQAGGKVETQRKRRNQDVKF